MSRSILSIGLMLSFMVFSSSTKANPACDAPVSAQPPASDLPAGVPGHLVNRWLDITGKPTLCNTLTITAYDPSTGKLRADYGIGRYRPWHMDEPEMIRDKPGKLDGMKVTIDLSSTHGNIFAIYELTKGTAIFRAYYIKYDVLGRIDPK